MTYRWRSAGSWAESSRGEGYEPLGITMPLAGMKHLPVHPRPSSSLAFRLFGRHHAVRSERERIKRLTGRRQNISDKIYLSPRNSLGRCLGHPSRRILLLSPFHRDFSARSSRPSTGGGPFPWPRPARSAV